MFPQLNQVLLIKKIEGCAKIDVFQKQVIFQAEYVGTCKYTWGQACLILLISDKFDIKYIVANLLI